MACFDPAVSQVSPGKPPVEFIDGDPDGAVEGIGVSPAEGPENETIR
jgi:hypothetical protein